MHALKAQHQLLKNLGDSFPVLQQGPLHLLCSQWVDSFAKIPPQWMWAPAPHTLTRSVLPSLPSSQCLAPLAVRTAQKIKKIQAMGSALMVFALLTRAAPERLRLVMEGEHFISPASLRTPLSACCSSATASVAAWRLSPGTTLQQSRIVHQPASLAMFPKL